MSEEKKVRVRIDEPIAGDSMPQYDQPSFSYAPGSTAYVSPALADAWEAAGICTRMEEGR